MGGERRRRREGGLGGELGVRVVMLEKEGD